MIHWGGAYHVFYQWNPDGCEHLNKHWGHVRTTDFVHWEALPTALAPDAAYDSHGCYSGSAVDLGYAMALLYTGNVRDAAGDRSSFQCLALSSDGIQFEKLGPVIAGAPPGYSGHFRDPKVWRQRGAWHAVIGAQRAADSKGTVVLARSEDLRDWRMIGELLRPEASCYMVECPDLFELDGTTVLICCRQTVDTRNGVMSRADIASYTLGNLELDRAEFAHGGFRPLDRGFDFYAPQTLRSPDGRRLMIGWMGLPLRPETPTAPFGWTHCLTMPRELALEQGHLRQRPLRELTALRGDAVRMPSIRVDAGGKAALPHAPGDAWELDLSFDAGSDDGWTLHILESDEQVLRLAYDGSRRMLALVRHCPVAGQFDERSECAFEAGVTRIQAFVDRSSVEIFVNDGEEVFTTRCYPSGETAAPYLTAKRPLRLHAIDMWPIRHVHVRPDQRTPTTKSKRRET
ncbi:glycoside hydrolase family 32 protein [Trinickia caryophylli]|uniref:glycoside hydrolase family 32 protein n=1 Tax=Trinickia caryophylli TaxID=28094 RepID=UPI0036260415